MKQPSHLVGVLNVQLVEGLDVIVYKGDGHQQEVLLAALDKRLDGLLGARLQPGQRTNLYKKWMWWLSGSVPDCQSAVPSSSTTCRYGTYTSVPSWRPSKVEMCTYCKLAPEGRQKRKIWYQK